MALSVIVLAVFWQTAGFAFLTWDDLFYVTENPRVRMGITWDNASWALTATDVCNWHPLTWISHMGDVSLYGLWPGGHHLTSVFFHALNAVLLYAFFRTSTGESWRSGLLAILFAIHPLHVESVAWVSERKDVLSTFFWLAAMLSYARYSRNRGLGWYLVVTLLIAAGIASKPMVIALPMVLLLLDYWPLKRLRLDANDREPGTATWRLVAEKMPWLVLSIGSAVVTYQAQSACGTLGNLESRPLTERFAQATINYGSYLYYTVVPWNLSYMHVLRRPLELTPLVVSAAVLGAISLWVVTAWRSRPERLVGWLWYLGTLVPVIGLVQVGPQSIAARYSYVPLIGLFLIVAWSIPDLGRYSTSARRVAGSLFALVLAVVAAIAVWQVQHWRESTALFRRALEIDARNHVAHFSLADALAREGRFAEAKHHANATLAFGQPHFSKQALNTLGSIADQEGRQEEALDYYERALRLDGGLAVAHFNKAVVLLGLRRFDQSAAAFEAALEIVPGDAQAHSGRAFALSSLGRHEEAAYHYGQAIEIDPRSAEPRFNLGVELEALGRDREAIASYEAAIALPDDGGVSARLRLARLLLDSGQGQEAKVHLEAVLQRDPQNNDAIRLFEEAQRR